MPLHWRRRLFFLCLPLLAGLCIGGARIETDLNAFFTAVDSEDAAFLASFLQSGELSRRYLIAVRMPPDSELTAEALAEQLAQRLATAPGVERAWPAHRGPADGVSAFREAVERHPGLFSLDPERDRSTVLDPASLAARAAGLKRALLSPEGAWIKQWAPNDPLLLALNPFRDLKSPLQAKPTGGEGLAGLILQAQAAALDTASQANLQETIQTEFHRLCPTGCELLMTGIPVFTAAAHQQIARDVASVSVVSSVAIVAIFLWLFRSLTALGWVFLIVGCAYAVGMLATAVVFGSVHSLTLALGSTLTGVSIDYPMHVLAHTAQHPGEQADRAIRRVWPSLFVGALTTVIGYAALGFAGFPGFRQIAVFSIAAIGATLALTRWVLPALLDKVRLNPPRVGLLNAWVDLARGRRRLVLWLVGLCLAFTIAWVPHLRWMDDLSGLAMDLRALKETDRIVRTGMGGIEPGRFVIAEGGDLDDALLHAEAAERRLRAAEAAGALQSHVGFFPWLVSTSLQHANAGALGQVASAEFTGRWQRALRDAGLSADKLGQVVPASAPVAPDAALTPAMRTMFAGQIVQRGDRVALVIWLGAHRPDAVAAALEGLSGVRYFSQKDLLDGLARDYRDRSLRLLGGGLVLIWALLALRYRSAAKATLSLAPAVIAAVVLFAAWAALGQAISFVHVMCLLLAVSICEDYGIFFLDNGSGDVRASYQAVAPSMLTTAASFAALGLAENPTLQILAAAVTLAVVLGFLLCPVLIRPNHRIEPTRPNP